MTKDEYMEQLVAARRAGVSPEAAIDTLNEIVRLSSPVKLVPAFIQRLWLDGLSLHKIALAIGSTPQEVEDVMRKRTARLVRERAR